jgi:DNA-binding FadR family transcriptional regulator
MPLSSPRRSALADQVIVELRQQITSGEWPVGSRIPTEPELVEQLGVARNTVREAIRALAHNGLLDIRQGSGTYVLATSELAGVMHRRFADADPRHVAELRSTMEATGARLAAERRTEADIAQLEALLRRREEAWASGEVDTFVDADATFHMAVVTASHNEVLTALYADLGAVLRAFLRHDVGDELRDEQHLDHARLVVAIRDHDPDTAATEAGSYAMACRRPEKPDLGPAGQHRDQSPGRAGPQAWNTCRRARRASGRSVRTDAVPSRKRAKPSRAAGVRAEPPSPTAGTARSGRHPVPAKPVAGGPAQRTHAGARPGDARAGAAGPAPGNGPPGRRAAPFSGPAKPAQRGVRAEPGGQAQRSIRLPSCGLRRRRG